MNNQIAYFFWEEGGRVQSLQGLPLSYQKICEPKDTDHFPCVTLPFS